MENQEKKTKKKSKKILKWIFIPLASIIAIALIIVGLAPLIAESYANSESGNKTINDIACDYINANIKYEKIKLDVWSKLPDVELEIIGATIHSKALKNDLSDTLAIIDTLSVSVNAVEFLNDSIIINKLLLSNTIINGYVNPEGKANWDIYISDTTPEEEDTSSFDYIIKLKDASIKNLHVNYIDDESQMTACLDSTNISLSGDMTADILNFTTELNLKARYADESSQFAAEIPTSTLNIYGNINDGNYELTTNFGKISTEFCDSSSNTKIIVDDTELKASAFINDSSYDLNSSLKLLLNEFGDSSMSFNDIPLDFALKVKCDDEFNKFDIDTLDITSTDIFVKVSGTAEYMTDSSWNTDLNANISIPRIDNVLNFIPESLISGIKDYKISGALNFCGKAQGRYKNDTFPNIEAKLSLSDIEAVAKDMNATAKLNLDADLSYNSENKRKSYINISELNASAGETYIKLKGKASNILNDPYIDAKLNCDLNLDYISSLFPIDDLIYKGNLSSDFEARFSLSDLMKINFTKIYMLGNIDIDRIMLRIPSQKFFAYGENASAEVGMNSKQSRRTGQTHLTNAKVVVDTLKITMPRTIQATISRLNLNANVDEPVNEVPQMRVSGRLNGMQAIVADTMFVSGKSGRISMSVRPDEADALIPALKATLNLDSITYYEPTMGAFLDSTRIEMNGRPRIRKFMRVDGKRVEIDPTSRTPIDMDSLLTLCNSVTDAESALKKFTFDGKIYAKTARYMSPYFNLRTAARKFDITFTDDTIQLNNFFMRVGKSGLRLNGKIENVRRALLRDKTLSGNIEITSRNLDLNELLYANYIGEQEKLKDDVARKAALERIDKMQQKSININHVEVSDSVKAQIIDSIRKTYTKRDLSEIYTERMGKMKEFIDLAYSEEKNITDEENEATDTSSSEIDLDTVPMELIVVPANLNCGITVKMDTIKFAGLKMNDFNGEITAQNSTLSIKDLRTSSNIGDLKLSATYQCDNLEKAKVGLDLFGTNVTVENLLTAVPMIDSILPMLSSFEGKLDCELSAIADLDNEMEPVLSTLQTACHINGKDLVLLDGETFTTIAKYLLFKKQTKNVIDNMSVEFTIDNNILSVYPFTLSMDKYKVAVSGKMDFDFKYFFHISVLEPKGLPIPLGINVQTKEPKENKGKKKKNDEEEGELVEESDDFEFRLVKPLYKDEKAIAQSINLVNKSGLGRISLQQTLRKSIQNIIENYDEKKEQ